MERVIKHALLVLAIRQFDRLNSVEAVRKSWEDDSAQCIGTYPDLSRLQLLSDMDISWIASPEALYSQTNSFAARKVSQVTSADGTTCLGERHRLREHVEGIPVFGADFVVTTARCSDYSSIDRNALIDTNTLAMLASNSIVALSGYKAKFVDVPSGYTPKHSTKEDAITSVAGLYGVAREKVTTLSLEIYATAHMDYRAWIGTVLVDIIPGEPHVYQVVVNDETDEILFQCEIGGFRVRERKEKSQRQAKSDQPDFRSRVNASACESCSAFGGNIAWQVDQIVECDAQTLYLNNTGRKTLCINGTDSQGNHVVGPGPIPELHWNGTLNCNSMTTCQASPMPNCADAISDVQWGVVNYLQYIRKRLGIMGGLVKDAENPLPLVAMVHYDYLFCNAFYLPGEYTVYFGDCDCDVLYPLVSTDVVVHEVSPTGPEKRQSLF
jgi:Thermolysin metallopeptidase, catalytic domain